MLKTIDPLLDADLLEELGAGGHGDRPATRETYCVIATGKRRLCGRSSFGNGHPSARRVPTLSSRFRTRRGSTCWTCWLGKDPSLTYFVA
jgi:hypothetical protein